jgi:hypothetical protein
MAWLVGTRPLFAKTSFARALVGAGRMLFRLDLFRRGQLRLR